MIFWYEKTLNSVVLVVDCLEAVAKLGAIAELSAQELALCILWNNGPFCGPKASQAVWGIREVSQKLAEVEKTWSVKFEVWNCTLPEQLLSSVEKLGPLEDQFCFWFLPALCLRFWCVIFWMLRARIHKPRPCGRRTSSRWAKKPVGQQFKLPSSMWRRWDG